MDHRLIHKNVAKVTKEGKAQFFKPRQNDRFRMIADESWDSWFYTRAYHFVGGRSVLCLAQNESLGIPIARCPVCARYNELNRSSAQEDKDAAREIRVQVKHGVRGLVVGHEVEGVKIWEMSGKALAYLKGIIYPDRYDDDGTYLGPGDGSTYNPIWDYHEGYNLVIKMNNDSPGFSFAYGTIAQNQRPTPLTKVMTEQEFRMLLESVPPPIDPDEIKTAAELKALILNLDDPDQLEAESDDQPARGQLRGRPSPPPARNAVNRPPAARQAQRQSRAEEIQEDLSVDNEADFPDSPEDLQEQEMAYDEETGEVYDDDGTGTMLGEEYEEEAPVDEPPPPPPPPARPAPRTSAPKVVGSAPASRPAPAPAPQAAPPRQAPPRVAPTGQAPRPAVPQQTAAPRPAPRQAPAAPSTTRPSDTVQNLLDKRRGTTPPK
jgi:hypothetical protein